MPNPDLRTDDTVLADLGARLSSLRLSYNLTQAKLAKNAGVSKRTLERIEAGHSAQLTSFIRILRALGLLDRLDELLPPPQPGPIDLLRREGKRPQRATGGKVASNAPWTWADEA
jgi:transcriptional regulator with XRE-family HTH domain